MHDLEPHPQAGTPEPAPPEQGRLRALWRHRVVAAALVFALSTGMFIAQNLEPTSIDFLFWSLLDVPKVVLIILGVPAGAIGWELIRRTFR